MNDPFNKNNVHAIRMQSLSTTCFTSASAVVTHDKFVWIYNSYDLFRNSGRLECANDEIIPGTNVRFNTILTSCSGEISFAQ